MSAILINMLNNKNDEQATKQVAKMDFPHGKTTKKAFAISQLEEKVNRASELKTFISEVVPLSQIPEIHFFHKKSELTEFAEPLHGDKYRTTLSCSCDYDNRRRGILVVDKNNHVTHYLIRCNNCTKKLTELVETERGAE